MNGWARGNVGYDLAGGRDPGGYYLVGGLVTSLLVTSRLVTILCGYEFTWLQSNLIPVFAPTNITTFN